MYYHLMTSTDIRENLATEEYLMSHLDFDEPLLLFYIQEPAIILGKHQNSRDEINLAYATEQEITITRRLSGGGAVYDDLGNLSFSFVTQAADQRFGDFNFFAEPILSALKSLGVTEATLSGRNDLLVDGKKFSGNAMYQRGSKLFCHGTLMLDVDLTVIENALTASEAKLKKHGVASVRSRVTNLRPFLNPEFQQLTTQEFRDYLLLALFKVDSLSQIAEQEYQLTVADQLAIAQLTKSRYANPEWVYGASPRDSFKRRKDFPSGSIEVQLVVERLEITDIRFSGDYFSQIDTADLEQHLIGQPYRRSDLENLLQDLPIGQYFDQLTHKQLLALLIDGE